MPARVTAKWRRDGIAFHPSAGPVLIPAKTGWNPDRFPAKFDRSGAGGPSLQAPPSPGVAIAALARAASAASGFKRR